MSSCSGDSYCHLSVCPSVLLSSTMVREGACSSSDRSSSTFLFARSSLVAKECFSFLQFWRFFSAEVFLGGAIRIVPPYIDLWTVSTCTAKSWVKDVQPKWALELESTPCLKSRPELWLLMVDDFTLNHPWLPSRISYTCLRTILQRACL